MGRVLRTRQAREDVLDIWEHIASDNRTAADQWIQRLSATVQLLAEQPMLGSSQEKFRVGLRCLPLRTHLIFYEPIPDGIRVLRILHSARRWEDLIQ